MIMLVVALVFWKKVENCGTRFFNLSDIGCERKRGAKDHGFKFFGLSNSKKRVAVLR